MRCWMVICYTRRRVDVVILDGERNGRGLCSEVPPRVRAPPHPTPPRPRPFLRVASIHDLVRVYLVNSAIQAGGTDPVWCPQGPGAPEVKARELFRSVLSPPRPIAARDVRSSAEGRKSRGRSSEARRLRQVKARGESQGRSCSHPLTDQTKGSCQATGGDLQ